MFAVALEAFFQQLEVTGGQSFCRCAVDVRSLTLPRWNTKALLLAKSGGFWVRAVQLLTVQIQSKSFAVEKQLLVDDFLPIPPNKSTTTPSWPTILSYRPWAGPTTLLPPPFSFDVAVRNPRFISKVAVHFRNGVFTIQQMEIRFMRCLHTHSCGTCTKIVHYWPLPDGFAFDERKIVLYVHEMRSTFRSLYFLAQNIIFLAPSGVMQLPS